MGKNPNERTIWNSTNLSLDQFAFYKISFNYYGEETAIISGLQISSNTNNIELFSTLSSGQKNKSVRSLVKNYLG